MKSCAYLRVSRQTQETNRQEDSLLQYAKNHNIEIVKVFKERITGISTAFERPKFSEMLDFISTNGIKLILTTELSRLGRDKRDLINIVEYFVSKKIQVIFKDNAELKLLDQNGNRNWVAGIVIDILSSFAQMERETTIVRNKSGMQYSISMGGSGYGLYKPYGFKKTELSSNNKIVKKLELDEDEAATVKIIFDKYLEGLGTKQIANFLNNKKIKTRYHTVFNDDREVKTRKGLKKPVKNIKWSDGTIYSILKNRIYIGERKLNEYEYSKEADNKGLRNKKDRILVKTHIYKVPPIIDIEIFEKVQRRLSENYNKSGNNTKYENILKEKIFCGICNHNYFMHKRANNRDNAYKCTSIRYNNNCGNYSINIDKLNNAVYFYLSGYVKFEHNENMEYIKELKVNEKNYLIVKQNIIKDLEDKSKEFENILNLNLGNENFQQIITEKSNMLQSEIEKLTIDLENIIKEIETNKELIHNLENTKFQDIVNDAATFKKYVSKVIEEIRIYKYPDKKLANTFPNKQDKLLHCSIVTINKMQYDFIISQRSENMIIPLMESFYSEDFITPFENTYVKVKIPKAISID